MKIYTNLSAALLVLCACTGDQGDDTGAATSGTSTSGAETTGEPEPTSGEGSTGEPACVEDDLAIVDFRGPGYDADMGGLLPPLQDTYIASTTVLVLRPDKMNDFINAVTPMFAVLEANPGFVGYSLAGSEKCGTQRTMTIWRDEDAMLAFVISPEHQAGVGMASELSTTGTVTAWDITKAEVPVAWTDAIARAAAAPKAY